MLDEAAPDRIGHGLAVAGPPLRARWWARPAGQDGAVAHRLVPVAAVAATAICLAPLIAVIVQRAGHHYLPVGDQAVIDLRVRDVFAFSGDTPLTGAWSRFGWSHPGPLMYYLVAPFARLFGSAAWATLVGFVLLQAAAVVWTARLAWRTGGARSTVIWMTILAASYAATGPVVLQQPWNPNVALPFFVLLLLQCRVVAGGDGRRLPGLAFVATFLVQAHIGYALPVAALVGWAVAIFVRRRRRAHPAPARAPWLPTMAVLGVLWFPPLVLDPVLHFPGNIWALARFYAGSGGGPILGLSHGLGYLATEFRWLPPWLGGRDPLNPLTALAAPSSMLWLVAPVLLAGAAWWAARRSGSTDLRRAAELVLLLLVASAATIVLLRGDPHPYLFYWRAVAGSATVILSLTVAARVLAGAWHRAVLAGWLLLLVVVLTVTAGDVTRQVVEAGGPASPAEPVAASLLRQIGQQDQPSGPTLVRVLGSGLAGVRQSLVDQWTREGRPVYVDRGDGFEFGYGRTAAPGRVRWVMYVTEESQLYSLISTLPGARVLAVSHPLGAGAQAELVAVQRRLAAELTARGEAHLIPDLGSPLGPLLLTAGPNMSGAVLQHLAALNGAVWRHTCLCSVIEFPAAQLPLALARSG